MARPAPSFTIEIKLNEYENSEAKHRHHDHATACDVCDYGYSRVSWISLSGSYHWDGLIPDYPDGYQMEPYHQHIQAACKAV